MILGAASSALHHDALFPYRAQTAHTTRGSMPVHQDAAVDAFGIDKPNPAILSLSTTAEPENIIPNLSGESAITCQQAKPLHNQRKRTLNIKYVVIKHFYKSMKHILYPFLHIHRIFATENQRRTAITTQASAYCFKSSTLKEKTLPTAFTT